MPVGLYTSRVFCQLGFLTKDVFYLGGWYLMGFLKKELGRGKFDS